MKYNIMNSAREIFEERYNNETVVNPSQSSRDKEREWMIYLCGWEDGISSLLIDKKKKEN